MSNTNLTDAMLKLGQETTVPDGTYYGTAAWDTKARDYLDRPGLYRTEGDARKNCPMGTRMVRWTVHNGSVTTRRGLQ